MKTIRKAAILLILIIGMMGAATQKATAQVSVSFQLFYDDLSPYGNWVDNSNYGYVWVPNVSRGFAPYRTNGYWVYTEMGWTWVSDYSWGWAPFHYGRWFYDSYYGWVWVPDTQWAPAWVTWRYYDGYYGWAAIGPGIGIDIAFSSGYNVPHDHWVFVRERDFGRRNISNYYVNNSNNTTIINNSTVINNIQTDNSTWIRYNAGPNRSDVQKRSKANIAQVNLRDRGKPGQNISGNELQLYKPRIERGDNEGKKPAPAKVTRQNDIKPANKRKNVVQPKREITQPQREINKPREQKIEQQKRQEMQMQRNEERVKKQEVERRQKEAVQQQERQKVQIQRNEERAKEQQIQRREPVQQQRDLNTPLNKQYTPQIRQQEMRQQHENAKRERQIRQKTERNK